MQQVYVREAERFLIASQGTGGGWPYAPDAQHYPEPTAWTVLALHHEAVYADAVARGVEWMKEHINPLGAFTLDDDADPHWGTSWVLFTLARLQVEPSLRERCARWLLSWEGVKVKPRDEIPLNSLLSGWPWTEGAFSWVEPTAYALLALKVAGWGDHPRVAEGEALLLDRACEGGGWNYGNRIVMGRALPPFMPPTAIALLALQHSPEGEAVKAKSLDVLMQGVMEAPSSLSLAWAILCLHAYNRSPDPLVPMLVERQRADGSWYGMVHTTALALLALQAAEEGNNVFKL